jgi:hypothetical protein
VLREICYVGKGRITFAHIFPIFGRDLVAGIARELLRDCVRLMRELGVIDFGFRWNFELWGTVSLRSFLGRCPQTPGRDNRSERYRRRKNYRPSDKSMFADPCSVHLK